MTAIITSEPGETSDKAKQSHFADGDIESGDTFTGHIIILDSAT